MEEQRPFLQRLKFPQDFRVVEDVDVGNVVFDNGLVDDDHVVYIHLVDVDNRFRFVH